MTQKEHILSDLKRGWEVSDKAVARRHGFYRLGDLIHRLRRDGHEIETIQLKGEDRYGNKTTYAKYKLIKEAK